MNNSAKVFVVVVALLVVAAIVVSVSINMFSSGSVDTGSPQTNSSQHQYISASDRTTTPKPTIASFRKVIKNASVSLTVENVTQSIKLIYQAVEKHEGLVVNQTVNTNENTMSTKNASLTIWVPAEKLTAFVEDINSFGKVTGSTIQSQDITDTYVDTEARMTALKTQEKRMLQLLANDNNDLDQILRLENELARLRAEIESLEGRVRQWDRQVAYSSINISLTQPVVIATPTEEPLEVFKPFYALFSKMSEAFLISFSKNLGFIAFVLNAIAVLVPWLVTAVLGFFLWKFALRKVAFAVVHYLRTK